MTVNSAVILFIDEWRAGAAPVPGNKSSLTFWSDHKIRAGRSQVSGTEGWKPEQRSKAEPDAIQTICCTGLVGHGGGGWGGSRDPAARITTKPPWT